MNIDEQSMKNQRKIDGNSLPNWLQFWLQVEAKMGPKWPHVGHQEAPKSESTSRGHQEAPKLAIKRPLGASWGPLGSSRGHLGRLGPIFRRLWALLDRLGAFWGRLGGLLGRLGATLGRFGTI